MICRHLSFLIAVCTGLFAVQFLSPFEVKAQAPADFPSHAQPHAGRSLSFTQPAPLPQPTSREKSSHLTEPAHFPVEGLFPTPVSCQTLVEYTLGNNPEIQAARYQARAMGAKVPQARSLADPQLMTTVYLDSIQTAAGPQDVVMSLSQRFPWFGKRDLRGSVAYHEAMAAYERLAAVELEVIERVKRSYFDLYFLRKAIEETRKLEPRLEDVIAIAQTKYKTGAQRAGLETVLQARVELAKLKTNLVRLEQAHEKARAQLAAKLHVPPRTELQAEGTLRRAEVMRTADLLVGLVESCQPRLDAYRREVCRDRTRSELAAREYWPDVTMSFNWHEIGPTGLSPVATGEDAYSLGVGVNLPIYRKRLDAAVREAQYNTARSVRRYTAERDKLHAEVQSLHAELTEQQQVLEILESEILPPAQQTLDLAAEGYRSDRVDFQQLIDTYRTLLEYRVDYHRREAAREQLIASLERAVGCSITSWSDQPDASREP